MSVFGTSRISTVTKKMQYRQEKRVVRGSQIDDYRAARGSVFKVAYIHRSFNFRTCSSNYVTKYV